MRCIRKAPYVSAKVIIVMLDRSQVLIIWVKKGYRSLQDLSASREPFWMKKVLEMSESDEKKSL